MSHDQVAFADVEETFHQLGTGPNGLSLSEARLRLQRYGPNVLPSPKKSAVAGKLAAQFKNLFNVLLLVASTLSFLSGWAYNDSGSIQMAFAILAVVVLNAFFSFFQEYRAEKAVQSIARLVPTNAKVIRDSQLREIKTAEIVPGDLIALEEGDRVPADARLISAFETSVDNSILTGESEPQRRFATMTRGTIISSITDCQNIVFAGTTVVTGIAKGLILKTGKETQFGKVISLSREIKEPLSPLEKEIDHMAKIDFLASIAVGVLFFVIAKIFVNLSVVESLLFAIGVMICLVPEGFQLTVSLALALTAVAMAKRNVVVKRLSAVETLGSTTVMCIDKTGTITSGEMMVKKLWTNNEVFEVTGDGYAPEGFVTFQGRRTNRSERPYVMRLFEVAAFCNNAKLNAPSDRISRWTVLGDPTDGAFLVFAGKGDFNVAEALKQNTRITLIPFDSKRRLMTSIHKTPDGRITAYSKGSSNELLSKCSTILLENENAPLDGKIRDMVQRQIDAFASEGFRVLAAAERVLSQELTEFMSDDVEKDLTFLGLVALFDPPRPMIEKAVSEARSAGIRVIMVTGDHELTAESIAKKIGIASSLDHVVVSGSDLSKMPDRELSTLLNKQEITFARMAPEQKLRVVKAFKSIGEIVAVTGDGVNDSPALMEAEVGVAMGVGGTDVARESADLVLLDNNFVSLIEGVRLGRGMFDNLRKFVYYVFTHNWAELAAFIAFVLLQVPLPLLVVQVLAIDLAIEVPPSLALIMEPPELGIMGRPPRRREMRLVDFTVLLRSACVGIIIAVGPLARAFQIWMTTGWSFGQVSVSNPQVYAAGTSIVMAGIIAGQLGNFFSARSGSQAAFRLDPLRNKWLFVAILLQVITLLVIVNVPFLQLLFGTAPLSTSDWIYLYSLAPIAFLFEEGRKVVAKRLRQK